MSSKNKERGLIILGSGVGTSIAQTIQEVMKTHECEIIEVDLDKESEQNDVFVISPSPMLKQEECIVTLHSRGVIPPNYYKKSKRR